MANKNFISKIIDASSNAVKSLFGGSNESLNSGNYRSSGSSFGNNGWLFDQVGGNDVHFSFGGLNDIQTAYEKCAPVYSIVNKQAYAFTNGKTWVTNSKGKEATSEYAKKIKKLLNKPNALQNGKQFEAQAAIYLRLFGYCVILPIKPVGFQNEDAETMWIIPPYMCEFTFAKQTFYNLKKGFISSVKVKYGNEETIFTNPEEDLIILRDITPGFDNIFLPGSPIKTLQQNISNLIGIYNSKGMLINYRGALGILSPETDPNGAISLMDSEKEDIQNGLMRYGLKSNQWKFIISNSAMKWQQMGVPYRDLMLTEWAEDDTMVICDGLNYPFKLLANTMSSSMNGSEVEAFKKILYQDFVIPFAEMIFEQFNEAFHAYDNNCAISKDYSHISVLQADDVKKSHARKLRNEALLIEFQNDLITQNRWLELNGEDPIPDGNIYYSKWIASNPSLLRQMNNVAPANNNTENIPI